MSWPAFFNAAAGLLAHGARVINISLGRNGLQNAPHTPGQDTARAELGHAIAEAVRGFPQHPLWVIAAGNMEPSGDTYWSQLTAIADSLPTETVVVTGAGVIRGQLSPSATGRGHIDLAAPGELVTVMDGTGVHALTGTSFSAPLVSGTAGLLLSADASLTAQDVRQYLIEGAIRGGRTAGGFPIIDAYESLRLVASRAGGPICGNRVFVDEHDNLTIERDPVLGAASDDIIASGSAGPGAFTITRIFHGGKYVEMLDGDSAVFITLQNRHWVRAPVSDSVLEQLVPSTARPNGVLSHDGDSLVVIRQATRPTFAFDVLVQDTSGLGAGQLSSQPRLVAHLNGFAVGQAYPLHGSEILVAVSPSSLANQPEEIVGVNIGTGATRVITSRPGASLSTFLVSSETGQDFVMEYTSPFPTFTTCITEFHSVATGALERRITQPLHGPGCLATRITHSFAPSRSHQ